MLALYGPTGAAYVSKRMPSAFQDRALPVGGAAPGGREQAADVVQTTLLGDGADNVELGIFVYDDDGKYVAVNRQAAELLGYPRAELLTRHDADFTEGGINRRVLLGTSGARASGSSAARTALRSRSPTSSRRPGSGASATAWASSGHSPRRIRARPAPDRPRRMRPGSTAAWAGGDRRSRYLCSRQQEVGRDQQLAGRRRRPRPVSGRRTSPAVREGARIECGGLHWALFRRKRGTREAHIPSLRDVVPPEAR
jgi:PAS domain-containing protein